MQRLQISELLGNGIDFKGTSPEAMERLLELVERRSCLSDKAIKRAIREKRIFIEPFDPESLATSSYDVTLGPFYYRENNDSEDTQTVYNMYDQDDVRRVWGDAQIDLKTAKTYEELLMRRKVPPLQNIGDKEQLILLKPGETILAHTMEFIGGCDDRITTMMKARSSIGRNFISVCKCAGWGDVGYCNRWTMEITNLSSRFTIPLVVGRRIAQIVFFETEGIEQAGYGSSGKYASYEPGDFRKLVDQWQPSMMLPKMYNDREVRALSKK